MARKNLLQGLMEGATPPETPEPPAAGKGAIGAVSRSIADLQARAITDIAPDLIDAAGFQDRLEDGDLEALQASIAEYGQQVPVLLRPHPETEGRYQVVFGRRRVAALRALGQPVKAMVRSLDDQEFALAQGQENSARRDLSFIEKANFARQLRDAGYDRKIICDALHVDKTVISRMLAVVDAIPLDLIETIGAAPSVGRDRWLKLAGLLGQGDLPDPQGDTSDDRFDAVMSALTPDRPAPTAPPARPETQAIKSLAGHPIAQMQTKAGKPQFTFEDDRFADWLAGNLSRIHRNWQSRGGGD